MDAAKKIKPLMAFGTGPSSEGEKIANRIEDTRKTRMNCLPDQVEIDSLSLFIFCRTWRCITERSAATRS